MIARKNFIENCNMFNFASDCQVGGGGQGVGGTEKSNTDSKVH